MTARRPRLLDLFCCDGGAGMGYHLAGFDVFGVDLRRNLRNPFPHHRGDALDYLAKHGHEFDAVHASPPCQTNTPLRHLHPDDFDGMLFPMATHVDLIAETRDALNANGVPWILENVPFAALNDPVLLCGSMFDLGVMCRDEKWRYLCRHRLFESSHPLVAPGPCKHPKGVQAIGVYGNGGGMESSQFYSYKGDLAEARVAMGMPWASRTGVSEAIPPVYTEWLGVQLRDQIEWSGNEKTPATTTDVRAGVRAE